MRGGKAKSGGLFFVSRTARSLKLVGSVLEHSVYVLVLNAQEEPAALVAGNQMPAMAAIRARPRSIETFTLVGRG